MTYTIRHSDDQKLIDLDSEVIDTTTVSGIGLIGYLTPNYGETQSNNFVHLAENFANTVFPEKPLVGQLFYKKLSNTDGSLYICMSSSGTEEVKWKKLPLVYVGEEFPKRNNPITGDMWYDTINHQFKMYDENLNKWVSVGPENFNDTYKNIAKKDSNNSIVVVDEFDFNSVNIEKKIASYLVTIDVIGKELPLSEGNYIDSCESAAWKIQLLVNCYQKSESQLICNIVDEPDYEIIGKTSNASDWYAKAVLNNSVLRVEAKGSTSNENTKVRWISRISMLKVD